MAGRGEGDRESRGASRRQARKERAHAYIVTRELLQNSDVNVSACAGEEIYILVKICSIEKRGSHEVQCVV